MTPPTTRVPGVPVVEDGQLVSTNPATGAEVGRFPIASAGDVAAAVARAREAAAWWAGLGFGGRRERLLRWRALLAHRIRELAALMNAEGGKPEVEAIVEIASAIEHVDWSARNAKRVLGPRRKRSRLVVLEHSAAPGRPSVPAPPAGSVSGAGRAPAWRCAPTSPRSFWRRADLQRSPRPPACRPPRSISAAMLADAVGEQCPPSAAGAPRGRRTRSPAPERAQASRARATAAATSPAEAIGNRPTSPAPAGGLVETKLAVL